MQHSAVPIIFLAINPSYAHRSYYNFALVKVQILCNAAHSRDHRARRKIRSIVESITRILSRICAHCVQASSERYRCEFFIIAISLVMKRKIWDTRVCVRSIKESIHNLSLLLYILYMYTRTYAHTLLHIYIHTRTCQWCIKSDHNTSHTKYRNLFQVL